MGDGAVPGLARNGVVEVEPARRAGKLPELLQPLAPQLLARHRRDEILEFLFREVLAHPPQAVQEIVPNAALSFLGTLGWDGIAVRAPIILRQNRPSKYCHFASQCRGGVAG